MKKSQFESLIREVIRETIRKVDGKYVVYPEKGGKRLGTHSTKKAAEKQLTAIHLNKEAVEPNFDFEWGEAARYPEFKKLGKDKWIELAKTGKAVEITSAKDINNTDANEPNAFKTLDPNKQKRALAQLKSGNVEMPIVALYSDGYKELIGGNTRLTAMMAQNGKATIWQFEVPEVIEENYADDKEKEIANDILSGLNEGKLDGVLTKMKEYAKKGLLTLAVIASVTQGLQAQGIAQSDIDAVNQQGIELVQQDYTVSRMTERLIVQTLGQQKFDAFVKLAKENGLRLGAGKSRMLNIAQSQSRLNALSGINGQVTAKTVDSKTMKTSDGQYLVIQFLKVNVNENYADGKINEQEMSQDDFNTIGNVLRDSTKAEQIHSLLLQMFPQQKELLNYNYKNDSYAEFKRFIFHIDKYKLEGPVSINYTDLKLDPENMKARERKYQEYIDGKIDKYFRDTNSDPRKVDLSKMPPITVDETGEVMDGNHRAFLAIKQQKPLKGYKIVNANNTHPNVAKILQIVGREVKENYADGKVNESGYEEAWELLGQPVPEIKNFVKQLGLKNDDATAKKIGTIIDNIKDSSLPANRISVLKNLANKGNDSETLKAIKQISGKPDAEQQYIKLMQARDAGEKRNRGYNVSDLIKAVKSGNYDPPVLLQLPSGLYVIGGRTRLYAALALGVKAKVKIITSDTFKQIKENYADGKVKEVFTPSPLQNLVNDYLFLVTMNFTHIEKTGKTPKDVDALTQMIKHAKSDVNTLRDLSKEQLEKNKNSILQRIHDMLTYIISRMKAHMRPEEYEKRRDRLSKLLTLYKDAASVKENYADGKVKGKSRPGRVKKAGASCKGSVTDLRAKAKKYGGEKGKMYHWCANMKGGKKK